jgi:hypothetical protein
MRKVSVTMNLSLDRVMQAPGSSDEDTRAGFQRGRSDLRISAGRSRISFLGVVHEGAALALAESAAPSCANQRASISVRQSACGARLAL